MHGKTPAPHCNHTDLELRPRVLKGGQRLREARAHAGPRGAGQLMRHLHVESLEVLRRRLRRRALRVELVFECGRLIRLACGCGGCRRRRSRAAHGGDVTPVLNSLIPLVVVH